MNPLPITIRSVNRTVQSVQLCYQAFSSSTSILRLMHRTKICSTHNRPRYTMCVSFGFSEPPVSPHVVLQSVIFGVFYRPVSRQLCGIAKKGYSTLLITGVSYVFYWRPRLPHFILFRPKTNRLSYRLLRQISPNNSRMTLNT